MRSPLLRIGALRFAPDIVRSQPRMASLLSGNSVLRADFIRRSEADVVSADLQSAALTQLPRAECGLRQ